MPNLKDRIQSMGDDLSTVNPSMLPGWLVTGGVGAWLIVGMAGVVALATWFFTASADISIPLLVAAVVGMIAYPLCERMTARRVPKSLAAFIVLVMLASVIAGVIIITVQGIVTQWPSIQAQLEAGLAELAVQLEGLGYDIDAITAAIAEFGEAAVASGDAGPLAEGLLSSVGSALSGIANLLFGLFIGATLLYYVLRDFPTMSSWMSRHMAGLPVDVGEGIVEDSVRAMRGYFRGTTITGFAVAAMIGLAMLVLDVPLVVPVVLVTFLTCYIPYFGSIVSGAFAFLIALGSNGLPTALAVLAIVLIAQNVLQTVVNSRVMGAELNLHPLVVLVVTMLGGIFGGLLGAALGAPLAALLVNAGKRLSAAFGPGGEMGGPAAEPSEAT